MSTITKEQAKDLRNAFECWQQDYDPVEDKEQYDMFGLGMVAMDTLLASLEAERGMIRRFDLDMSDCDSCGQDCGADMVEDLDGEYVLWDEVLPHLYRYDEYTAPPAPVSVMDEAQSRELFEKNCMANIERNKWHPDLYAHLPAREQWAAWEACRAAMLHGADGNSPVIPDWQAKAEKLAELYGVSFVVFRNGESPQCADPSKVVISFTEEGLGHGAAAGGQ